MLERDQLRRRLWLAGLASCTSTARTRATASSWHAATALVDLAGLFFSETRKRKVSCLHSSSSCLLMNTCTWTSWLSAPSRCSSHGKPSSSSSS